MGEHSDSGLTVVISLGEMRGGEVWGPSLGHTSGIYHTRVRVRLRVRIRVRD